SVRALPSEPLSLLITMSSPRLDSVASSFGLLRSVSLPALFARIVGGIKIFEAERPDRRDLRDVLAGLCPMEVRRVAGQHNHTSRRKSLYLVAVEVLAQADVEDA